MFRQTEGYIVLMIPDLILSLHTPGNVLTDHLYGPGDILQILLGLRDQPQWLIVAEVRNTWDNGTLLQGELEGGRN